MYGYLTSENCRLSWNEHVEVKQAYEYLLEQISDLEQYKVKVIKDKEREEQKRQLEKLAAEVDKKASAPKPEPVQESPQEAEPVAPAPEQKASPSPPPPLKPPQPEEMALDAAEQRALVAAMKNIAAKGVERKPQEPAQADPRSPRR